ncbi:uncharacterized protein LOC135824277 isoform X2 [Sycon ciliatum]|uniref:uncharacterized protein LOC135824277 isoform X2 n=1 Tax=Sycon ciliatum TaxID=27933 RepID=UPI0031F671CF
MAECCTPRPVVVGSLTALPAAMDNMSEKKSRVSKILARSSSQLSLAGKQAKRASRVFDAGSEQLPPSEFDFEAVGPRLDGECPVHNVRIFFTDETYRTVRFTEDWLCGHILNHLWRKLDKLPGDRQDYVLYVMYNREGARFISDTESSAALLGNYIEHVAKVYIRNRKDTVQPKRHSTENKGVKQMSVTSSIRAKKVAPNPFAAAMGGHTLPDMQEAAPRTNKVAASFSQAWERGTELEKEQKEARRMPSHALGVIDESRCHSASSIESRSRLGSTNGSRGCRSGSTNSSSSIGRSRDPQSQAEDITPYSQRQSFPRQRNEQSPALLRTPHGPEHSYIEPLVERESAATMPAQGFCPRPLKSQCAAASDRSSAATMDSGISLTDQYRGSMCSAASSQYRGSMSSGTLSLRSTTPSPNSSLGSSSGSFVRSSLNGSTTFKDSISSISSNDSSSRPPLRDAWANPLAQVDGTKHTMDNSAEVDSIRSRAGPQPPKPPPLPPFMLKSVRDSGKHLLPSQHREQEEQQQQQQQQQYKQAAGGIEYRPPLTPSPLPPTPNTLTLNLAECSINGTLEMLTMSPGRSASLTTPSPPPAPYSLSLANVMVPANIAEAPEDDLSHLPPPPDFLMQ